MTQFLTFVNKDFHPICDISAPSVLKALQAFIQSEYENCIVRIDSNAPSAVKTALDEIGVSYHNEAVLPCDVRFILPLPEVILSGALAETLVLIQSDAFEEDLLTDLSYTLNPTTLTEQIVVTGSRGYRTEGLKVTEVLLGSSHEYPKRPVNIWTAQISKWREAEKRDILFLDITAKSGNPAFAPDWENLRLYKAGEMDEATYTERYIAKMRLSFGKNSKEWDKLQGHPRMALACYCQAGKYCHRLLFKELLTKFLSSRQIPVRLRGELT